MVTWSTWMPRSANSSPTSRYDSAKRRYQRTASTITSGGKQKPANAARTTEARRGRRVLIATVCLPWARLQQMQQCRQDGTVTLGGRRVPVRRPRVRTVGDDEYELILASYEIFTSADLLADGVAARMLGGLSTRGYPVGLEPVGAQVEQAATGTSRSAVSRRFVTATAERLDQLLHRPLGGQRWLVVFLDG